MKGFCPMGLGMWSDRPPLFVNGVETASKLLPPCREDECTDC